MNRLLKIMQMLSCVGSIAITVTLLLILLVSATGFDKEILESLGGDNIEMVENSENDTEEEENEESEDEENRPDELYYYLNNEVAIRNSEKCELLSNSENWKIITLEINCPPPEMC